MVRAHKLSLWALGGALILSALLLRPGSAAPAELRSEISVDGPALFYAVSGEARRPLWAVHCRLRLRGCIARAPGLVLRLDEAGAPWLLAAVPPGARISLARRNTSQPLPGLLTAPLDPEVLARLSAPGAALIVEDAGQVILQSPTEGLTEVAAYLAWLASDNARTLGDARLWPKGGPLQPEAMTPEVLERFAVQDRRAREAARQLVPVTKPQSEFALRAQVPDRAQLPAR